MRVYPPEPHMSLPLSVNLVMRRVILGAAVSLGMMVLAAGLARAEPALWKVTNGTATAYLFGSVHQLKHDAVWDTPKVEAALGQSQELWLEITEVDGGGATQPLVQQLGTDPSHPLSARLDDIYRARLTHALSALGAPPNAFDALRPWLAAVSLTVAPLQKAGYDPNAGVDRLLKQAAVKRGIAVIGFETLEEQLRYLSDMSPTEEMDMLQETLDDFDTALDGLDKLEGAWERGDDQTIAILMRKDMSEPLYQRLIAQRNKRFATRLAQRMQKPGVVFVAVGAGHLAGPDSVQAMLAQLGLHAQRQ